MVMEHSIIFKGAISGASALTFASASMYSLFSEGLIPNNKHFSKRTVVP